MRVLLPLLLPVFSGCGTTVVLPDLESFDPCRKGCDNLGSLVELPEPCLMLRPSVLDELNTIGSRPEEMLTKMNIPTGACACLIVTVGSDGAFSEIEIVETNAVEITDLVVRGIKNLPPTGPVTSCLESVKVPVVFPFE